MKVFSKEICDGCGVEVITEITDETDKNEYIYMAENGQIDIAEKGKDYIICLESFICSRCYEDSITWY